MGCGQSHIPVIYPRKNKNKNNPNTGAGSEDSDEEAQGGSEAAASNPLAEESPPPSDHEEENRAIRQQMVHISSSPLLAQPELSSSQSDFFRMLDEKINNGPDYVPPCEYELAMDQAQLCRLLQEWQAAKLRSRCGLVGGASHHGTSKLQRYHSLQSNGELSSVQQRKTLHHQMSTAYLPHQPQPMGGYGYGYHGGCYERGPPPPPTQYTGAGPPGGGYGVANSVVMYDKRGGYYTELA